MSTYTWKDKYLDAANEDITGTASYVASSGSLTGTGTRNNPFGTKKNLNGIISVIGNGSFTTTATTNPILITGQGFKSSLEVTYGANSPVVYLRDLRLNISTSATTVSYYFKNVFLENYAPSNFNNIQSYNSILCVVPTAIFSTNTYVNVPNMVLTQNLALVANSTIAINQTVLNNYKNNYHAFSKCNYLIGAEVAATPLTGATSDDLRANFVARCTAQGLTVPTISEYGETNIPVGRWFFSDSSLTAAYDTIIGSEIDIWSKKHGGIHLGHSSQLVTPIAITSLDNTPQSFSPSTPQSNVTVTDNSVVLNNVDVNVRNTGKVSSKIIYLGGHKKVSAINILDTLLRDSGIALDGTFALSDAPVTTIEAGLLYIVRSSDANLATLTYNTKAYDSSLLTRNNVFLGVAGVTSLTSPSANAQVYQVLDLANYNTIKMRIVDNLPTPAITTGNLQTGYWYVVTPNSMADQTGYVTYKGVQRPCFDSFLVDSTLAFTLSGAVSLRRCWQESYNQVTEVTDKSFWANVQKPQWFDVVPDDMRCFKIGDSAVSVEMRSDANGNYISSGHPDFYTGVVGNSGTKTPAYDIVGTWMQLELEITTQNPM